MVLLKLVQIELNLVHLLQVQLVNLQAQTGILSQVEKLVLQVLPINFVLRVSQ